MEVVFEAIPIDAIKDESANAVDSTVASRLEEIDHRLIDNFERLEKIDNEIESLTNHADKWDYALAVTSGIACGLIDSFFVGDFDWANAKKWSYQTINKKVSEFAKAHGYEGGSNNLKDHIAFLERKYEIPSDHLYVGKDTGIWTKSHHLDDFAHHPTIVGWICSILTQFTRKAYFANSNGEGFTFDVENNELIGDTIPEKFTAGTINWFGHLVSDIAGSSNPGDGMGLPGPIVSLIKEISQLPLVRETNLPKLINEVFVKHKFDLRKELALGRELGRQAIPVVINEIIVRLFFFLRRVAQEWREFGLSGIHWQKVLPFKNRTIVRMLTISTGTFTAVDLADAAIRSGVKSGGNPAAFWASFVLKVNFVGVGRFAVAVITDASMGVKLGNRRWERIAICNERLHLLNAKVELKNADVWIEVDRTGKAIKDLYSTFDVAINETRETTEAAVSVLHEIDACRDSIQKHNPGFLDELADFMDEP